MPSVTVPSRLSPRRSLLGAALAIAALASTLITPATPAEAAVGDAYKYYAGYASGTSIRTTLSSSNYTTALYSLQGQSGASSTSSYSVDFTGTPPNNNNNYSQRDWTELPQQLDASVRGRVEWILKNSYPRVTTTVLRDTIRATPGFTTFPTGYFSEAEAIAGTQAAIWRLTDGVELDQANSNPNTTRIKLLSQYLLQGSEGKTASTSAPPTVDIVSEAGRTAFSIEPGAAFGPFVLESSIQVTPTVTGAARLIDDAGNAIAGAQPAGTRFWVQPSAEPAAAGSATLAAQTAPVSTTVVNAAIGVQHVSPYAARENLAVLSTSTATGSDALTVSWEIDRNAPDSFDAAGSATERSYDYFQRGEQSVTLETLVFRDGDVYTSDLIRLTGVGTARSADVYSADYANTPNTTFGPLLPGGSRYQEKDWSAAAALAGNQSQGEVGRVLSSAYPERSVGEFTADLKAAGRLASSAGNIKNWEAIAAAQAAIWHFTDGKELDTTRYADPVSVLASSAAGGFGAENVLSGDPASGWRASEAGPAHLDFVFPAQFQPRSYTVTTLDGGSSDSTPASWKLQRSSDGGATYVDVSASSATGAFPGGAAQSRSTNIPDGATYGSYTDRYRLVFTGAADPGAPVEVGGVSFEGFGVFGAQPNYVYRAYANPANVVAAYEYLVDLALRSPVSVVAPVTELTGPAAPVERGETSELIGPFRLGGNVSAEVSVGGVGGAELLLDPSATPAASLVLPAGSEFWVRTGDVESGTLRISAASTAVSWVTARALEGAGVPALTQLGVHTLRSTQSVDVSFAAAPPATASVILPAAALSSPKAPGTAVVGALTTTGAEQSGGPLVALLGGVVALLGGAALLLRSAALRRAAHRRRV